MSFEKGSSLKKSLQVRKVVLEQERIPPPLNEKPPQNSEIQDASQYKLPFRVHTVSRSNFTTFGAI